ncbi:cadmium-translocating P-type ATPase [Candidatus Heimdallarchaeota archaeon B3_Heim]|nr:MAG: cadmium-translocating P-type ATPase [Candidatus Heimdallarchaeota archaeon B3_Heim]
MVSTFILLVVVLITSLSLPSLVVTGGFLVLFGAYFISGFHVLRKALYRLRSLDIANEYFLMSIATLGAIIIDEIPEAAAVMVFYTVGEYLQSRAVNKSRKSISELLDIRPDVAHLVTMEGVTTVPVENITPGNKILVKPGERVPLDGILVTSNANLDLSALTGESRPVSLVKGDNVLSGAITSSSIKIEVTVDYSESTVSRILNVVENATQHKSEKEVFITRFARYYTPFVLILAIMIATIPPFLLVEPMEIWIYRALVVLVISCPCALVVSIPLVYFAGIGKSSRYGVLLKGANVIDSLNEVSTVLFDKTGTLTIGKFEVVMVVPTENYTPQEVIAYAALAEAHSNHPIAKSILKVYNKQVDLSLVDEYEELPALGIKMKTKMGDSIIVGNDKMVHEIDCPHSACITDETAVYVVLNDTYIGYIIIDDKIKPTAFEAISNLRKNSVPHIGLLTGDTKNIAERVGEEIGIKREDIYASLMPLNKLEILEQYLQKASDHGGAVMFVGDGMNDAPVIARADVGVAMGAIGSDASIEAADLVIMDDNPDRLNDAIFIAEHTNKIAKQNIIMALGIKAIFIVLGTVGLASMWVAVFGDVGVTLLTVINSLKLSR